MRKPRPSPLDAEIAHAMEAPEALLPVLPWLLQDLPSLSGASADVLRLLAQAGLPRGATVLDLGCGRGEIALALAAAFDAQVTGIDAFAPFVEAARRAAAERGVGDRCRFRCADLREAPEDDAAFDAVLLIALGDLLGDPAVTVGQLRRAVRPGGLIVIDDAYLAEGSAAPQGYDGYADRSATEAAMTRHGDAVVARAERTAEMAAFNTAALAGTRPELAPDLDAYLRRQESETALMAGPVVPAIWLLRKRHGG